LIYSGVREKRKSKDTHVTGVQTTLYGVQKGNFPVSNLSAEACDYLKALGIVASNLNEKGPKILLLHALAIGYSPAYLLENVKGIRSGWPRIPLPSSKELLLESVQLGRRIATLLDSEINLPVRPELGVIGIISRVGGGSLDASGDLEVRAGWGHKIFNPKLNIEVVMPGQGKYQKRKYAKEELSRISQGGLKLGLKQQDIFSVFGEFTYDIFLNDIAYWKNVPSRIWNYIIGGHQVLKKWLSYREYKGIKRSIKPEEAREFTDICRRIGAIILLENALDDNYRKIKSNAYLWNQ
jgi:hypothetical protein